MSRETHVRFSEGVGVGFPRATRLSASLRNRRRGDDMTSAEFKQFDINSLPAPK